MSLFIFSKDGKDFLSRKKKDRSPNVSNRWKMFLCYKLKETKIAQRKYLYNHLIVGNF